MHRASWCHRWMLIGVLGLSLSSSTGRADDDFWGDTQWDDDQLFGIKHVISGPRIDDDQSLPGEDEDTRRRRIAHRNVYSWVLGGSHKTLESRLKEKIDADDVLCGLTDDQRTKLRLAGRGDIQRLLMQTNRLCDEYASHLNLDDHKMQLRSDFNDDVRELAIAARGKLFGPDSFFEKARGRALKPKQMQKVQAVAALREAGAAVKPRTDRQVGVREVHLSVRPVTDAVLPNLAELPELEALSLDATRVSDDGLRHLAPLQQLKWLDLSRSRIGDEGMKHVARLSRLERLELSETLITDAGIEALLSLKKLKSIDVSKTAVTEAGIAKLRGAFPEVSIVHQSAQQTPD